MDAPEHDVAKASTDRGPEYEGARSFLVVSEIDMGMEALDLELGHGFVSRFVGDARRSYTIPVFGSGARMSSSQLNASVTDRLRDDILEGSLAPGTRLIELQEN